MEFLGDVDENVDIDGENAVLATATMDTADNATLELEEDVATPKQSNKVRDESFESSTAVIDEAKDTALQLMPTATTTTGDDETVSAEDEDLSVDEAVTLWKSLGVANEDKEANESRPPPLDRERSLFDAAEALAEPPNGKESARGDMESTITVHTDEAEVNTLGEELAVKITIENTQVESPQPVEVSNTLPKQTNTRNEMPRVHGHPKGFFEATLDIVGMDKMLGVDEKSLQMALAQNQFSNEGIDVDRARGRSFHREGGTDTLERVLDSMGVDVMCGVDDATIGVEVSMPSGDAASSSMPALVTPVGGSSESDYSFPEMLRGTKDIFANTELVEKGRHNISPDIFSNEFGSDDHPESLEHVLWDRLAGLCEPLQLQDETEHEMENDIVLTSEETTKSVPPISQD